jgi:hypothetical protein
VLLFQTEYPDAWPLFFRDLLGLLAGGPPMIDIFLRITKTIDEEVVSPDLHRSPADIAHTARIKVFVCFVCSFACLFACLLACLFVGLLFLFHLFVSIFALCSLCFLRLPFCLC